MTAEEIIKDNAVQFCRRFGSFMTKVDSHGELKDALQSELIDYPGPIDKLIFLYQVHNLLETEYSKHLPKCEHKDSPLKCSRNAFHLKSLYFVEQEIKELNSEFHFTILRPEIDSPLVNRNLISLKKFPEVAKLYEQALIKINEGNFERNLLDDLRLAFETLLKKILVNEKSMENQTSDLGSYLKKHEISPELQNMIVKLIDYYSKYQNSYVKHNDKVKEQEVSLILNLTSSFINFLIYRAN
jgi:hypothetical protein